MVEVSQFKAVTLNPLLNESETFVSPIYDTIDEGVYESYASNRRNIIHAIKRREGSSLDEFVELADSTIKMLFADRVLKEVEHESLYIYSIRYTIPDELQSEMTGDPGKRDLTLLGIVALVAIDDTGDEIVGHETVFDANTDERYQLMKKCRMNFSPILAEYNEDDTKINQILMTYITKNPSLIEIKHDGECHSLWEIKDQEICEYVIRSLKGQKLMILDGHHRYAASRRLKTIDGVDRTMMMLVGGGDPNLLLLPWHRCITGINTERLSAIVQEYVGSSYDDYAAFIEVFKIKDEASSALYDGSSFKILEGLDIFKLQKMIIDPLIEKGGKISFRPTIKDAVELVDQGRCMATFIVKAPKIGVIEDMAHRGIPLPQKSTRFLPKVMEGIILRRF
ncbi:MAG: DUF1015 family protein [Candidatus Syntropharchaeales archaeon]